ncbi:SspB family protein [Niveispirillum irakense]|uniref:SspB family protein n=1 Tax=Niveispirillum irakense TaxID=34011 RepID=UPI00041F653E|nr:ClpXP protease specificity-enhancing factor SspB [Niveispirillum irakense]
MSEDLIRYDRMVEAAKRSVVRQALREALDRGGVLPGEHHFYVTFRTDADGVEIPDYLRAKYPSEMTIVLQYQFYDLTVEAERFGVTLSFGGVLRRLEIPFVSIVTFADPSVNFVLQFQPDDLAEILPEEDEEEMVEIAETADITADAEEDAPRPTGTVVALDAFRKK